MFLAKYKVSFILLTALTVFLLLNVPGNSTENDFLNQTHSDITLNEELKNVTKKLRCPTCSDPSDNDLALENSVQASVQQLLEGGSTEQQIISYLVERYGYFAAPKVTQSSAAWLLWISPSLLLLYIASKIVIRKRKGNRLSNTRPLKKNVLLKLNMILLILLAGFALYFTFGDWPKIRHWHQVQQNLETLRSQAFDSNSEIILSREETESLILSLRTALNKNSNNVNDWLLLGSLNLELANYQQGLQAFSIAYRLSPDDHIVKNAYGQLLIRSFNPALSQFGKTLLSEVVNEDQQNLTAWSALAQYYASHGKYEQALMIWQSLLSKTQNETPERAALEKNINQAVEKLQQNN